MSVSNVSHKPRDHASGEARPRSRGNLVEAVGQALRQRILGGGFAVGEKLPSENGLTAEFKVSRTVIREAIASLRADGLVEARHGVGVFVLASQPTPLAGFRNVEPGRISSIIEMLELRVAVEMEAAALAATRRSPAQEEEIVERYYDIERLIAQSQSTSEADFHFHLAIADATNNPRFREFMEMIGKSMIPRASLHDGNTDETPADYLAQIQAEHREIVEAISARDASRAREAIRIHLEGSQKRYRSLIRRT